MTKPTWFLRGVDVSNRFLDRADPMRHDAKLKMPHPLCAPLKRTPSKLDLHRLQRRRPLMDAPDPDCLWRA